MRRKWKSKYREAREIEVALPKELDREKQIALVREYIKENLLSIFENLICKNADNHNTDLEQYIKNYQFLKEKNIISLSELKESIVTLRDKNYKTTRVIKDSEKQIDDKIQLIEQAKK